MDSRLLKSFITVIEEGSFSKAAKKLYVSQSTISAHIKLLENIVNAQLLIREGTGIMQTGAGKLFYKHAKNMVELENQALTGLSVLNHSTSGEIDIIASTIPAQFFLNKIIAPFQNKYPDVVFKIEQDNSYNIINTLDERWYDFAFVGTEFSSRHYNSRAIYNDEFALIIPKKFPKPKNNTLFEIAKYITNHPVIFRTDSSASQAETDTIISKLGVKPENLKISAYLSDSQSVVNAVIHGMGVAFISLLAVEYSTYVDVIRLPNDFFYRKLYMIYRKNFKLPFIQQLFLDYVSDNSI